jgi:AcrR family transcriptional regulator
MGEAGLTRDRILEAAVDVLRRFGPEKATVVDVARVLGVTHGSVYRYFPSKAALRDTVVQHWLEAMMPPLEAVAAEEGPAPERLRRWLDVLIAAKRSRATDDPELFAAYFALAKQARKVIRAHIDALVGLAARIIAEGVSDGEFAVDDPVAAGRAVLHATTRFHNPAFAAEWSDPGVDKDLDVVWHLLIRGLATRSPVMSSPRRARGKHTQG